MARMISRTRSNRRSYTCNRGKRLQTYRSPGLGQESRASPGLGQESRASPGLGQESRASPGLGQESRASPGLGQESRASPGLGQESRASLWLGQESLLQNLPWINPIGQNDLDQKPLFWIVFLDRVGVARRCDREGAFAMLPSHHTGITGAYPAFSEGGGERDPPNKLTSQTSARLSHFSLGLPV